MNNLKMMSGRAAELRDLRERLAEADTISDLRDILDRVIVTALADLDASAPLDGYFDPPERPGTLS